MKAAALRRVAAQRVEADAEAFLGLLGVDPVDDPVGELGRLAAGALAMVEATAARVNALGGIRYQGVAGGEQLRAEVALLERAQDRAGRLLDMVAKHQAARDLPGESDGQVVRAVEGLLALGDAAARVRAGQA